MLRIAIFVGDSVRGNWEILYCYIGGVEGRVKEVDNCMSMYFVSLCAKKQGVVGMTKIGFNVSL